jgi:hypothetical protein
MTGDLAPFAPFDVQNCQLEIAVYFAIIYLHSTIGIARARTKTSTVPLSLTIDKHKNELARIDFDRIQSKLTVVQIESHSNAPNTFTQTTAKVIQ